MKVKDFDHHVKQNLLHYFNCIRLPLDIASVLEVKAIDKKHLDIQQRLAKFLNEELGEKVIDVRAQVEDGSFRSLEDLKYRLDLPDQILEDLSIFWQPPYCKICRNIYLKIEEIEDYSPVDPQIDKPLPPTKYRRDCLRLPGHESAIIPDDEVAARAVDAIVFREYADADYIIPKTYKLINADINEPIFDRRVPGTVIYAYPGERLCIHVFNAHNEPHSFHIHGLSYGPDSDGSYPLGTQSSDGRRSDEICPQQSWTYIFDVDESMIGCWPFHSHYRNAAKSVKLGLFGGLVVLEKKIKIPPFLPVARWIYRK